MIAVMLLAAAASAGGMTAAPVAADGAAALIAEARDGLLEGAGLPADLDQRLRDLPAPDRLRVLVFLRRSGLLTGPGWSIDDLLAAPGQGAEQPVPAPEAGQ